MQTSLVFRVNWIGMGDVWRGDRQWNVGHEQYEIDWGSLGVVEYVMMMMQRAWGLFGCMFLRLFEEYRRYLDAHSQLQYPLDEHRVCRYGSGQLREREGGV